MHPDLSPHLHTEKCNEFIKQLKECHKNNQFRKFFGYCNSIDKLVISCLKEERLQKRKENYKKSVEMKARIHGKINTQA